MDINKATVTDYENNVDDVEIPTAQTDGVGQQDETEWTNARWPTQWGIFTTQADLQSALLMRGIWDVGGGYSADAETMTILDHISGWGKDSFQDILYNMDVMSYVGGDSFAEIIEDENTGTLLNLKPLDPGSIRTVVNSAGIIKRYEQISKFPSKGMMNKVKNFLRMKNVIKFEPNEIFHLSNDRMADQIHGTSKIDALEDTIKADNESFTDTKTLMHRQVKPFIIFKLKTDDQTEINNIISKVQDTRNKGEDLFIPDDDNILSYEVVQVNLSDAVFAWRNDIRNKFYRNVGLPQIVPGAGGNSTESESKVIYTAYGQIVKFRQRYLEQQIWNQLALKVNLKPPESFLEDLQNDEGKDGAAGLVAQPSDLAPGRGR